MLPDSPKKYSGIQQEFQSVLGNFKVESPRNYGYLCFNLETYTGTLSILVPTLTGTRGSTIIKAGSKEYEADKFLLNVKVKAKSI